MSTTTSSPCSSPKLSTPKILTPSTPVQEVVQNLDDMNDVDKDQIMHGMHKMNIKNFKSLQESIDQAKPHLKRHLSDLHIKALETLVDIAANTPSFKLKEAELKWPAFLNFELQIYVHASTVVGTGADAVYLASLVLDSKQMPCVAKKVDKSIFEAGKMDELFTRYYEYHLKKTYPAYIVAIYGIKLNCQTNTWIVMEQMQGDLFHMLFEKNVDLDLEDALDIMEQCCYAVAKLHELDLAHRDIKTKNFLYNITANNKYQIKICDFGTLKTTTNATSTFAFSNGATPNYMAPERKDNKLNIHEEKQSDVYSLAIVLAEIWFKKQPFSNMTKSRTFSKSETPYNWNQLRTTLQELHAMMMQSVKHDASARPSAEALLHCVQQARVLLNVQQELIARKK